MVLKGTEDHAYRRTDGVYVILIGCLKPEMFTTNIMMSKKWRKNAGFQK